MCHQFGLRMWWKEEVYAVIELVGIDTGAIGSNTKFVRWVLSEEDATQNRVQHKHLVASASHKLYSWNDREWLEAVRKLGDT